MTELQKKRIFEPILDKKNLGTHPNKSFSNNTASDYTV